MLELPYQIAAASGMRSEDREIVRQLVKAWADHYDRNMKRHTYYLMHNTLVDLGISIPPSLRRLDAACGWGKKVVDVMVEHSKFDGYTVDDEAAQAAINAVFRENKMRVLYRKATTSALEQSFNLYFVANVDGRARVRAYPANACGVVWDDAAQDIKAALFVVDMDRDRFGRDVPTWVNVVTGDYLIRIVNDGGGWSAEYVQHGLGRLPVFLAAYEATLDRPFGASRITREVMGYIDDAVRANINEEIAAAFAASTQKYLLGTDGDPFEGANRWSAYIGSIFNIDMTEDGTIPQFGQLPQPSMQPLTDHFRNLCAKMSAATGIHVAQFGIVHDQPASAEAIYAENSPLINKVKSWHDDVADTLIDVAIACLATNEGVDFDTVAQRGYSILPRFQNPAQPTLAQMTDAAVKLASVAPSFPKTRTFWQMQDFTSEQVETVLREIDEAEEREATNAAIMAMFGGSSELVDDGGNNPA